MPKDPMARSQRQRRRRERLPANARCAQCGEPDLDRLHLGELHHVVGQDHDPDLTMPLCHNCHAKASALQSDEGVPLRRAESDLEWVAAVLAALVAFAQLLADAFARWATRIEAMVEQLDRERPHWREERWAQWKGHV